MLKHATPESAHAYPSFRLSGRLRVPADKSISHRALILGALARGQTRISGLLESEDVLHTAEAVKALGAGVKKESQSGVWVVDGFAGKGGAGVCKSPEMPLYFGNAGTGVRLMMGVVAGLGVSARFGGDDSLSRRPMGRVLDPLADRGVRSHSTGGCLPVQICAGTPHAYRHVIPIASAQVKSALLFAGLGADGLTEVIEPAKSRDHTERMLRAFGAQVESKTLADGSHRVRLHGPADLRACDVAVPGDPSSAAFALAAALIVPHSDIVLENVLMNETRTGLLTCAQHMGGRVEILNHRTAGGEEVADIRVRGSQLRGIDVPASLAPSMIDEYPVLAVMAAFAKGQTTMRGIGELRVKESDRIERMMAMLGAAGVDVNCGDDWMSVTGTGAVWGRVDMPVIDVQGDHRIAMAAAVLGMGGFRRVQINNPSVIATSYPDFAKDMHALGASVEMG